MITFSALHFDSRTSKARKVLVESDGVALTLIAAGGEVAEKLTFDLSACRILPQLGSGGRMIRLPEPWGHLETSENRAVDELETSGGVNRGYRLLHLMESRWRLALLALFCCALAVFAASRLLVPLVADRAALATPHSATLAMSEKALEQLDGGFLKPSSLDEWRKEHVRAVYGEFCQKAGLTPSRLHFRSFPGGPNAFALPSDIIIVTDEIVEFTDDDDELLSVLAHESAHQSERHVLKQLYRNVGVFLLASAALGDATSVMSAAATLPTMLIERGYGREFENEADEIGAGLMVKAGLGVTPMVRFMEKMAARQPEKEGGDFLSTHPSMKKRVERLKELEAKNAGR